MNATEIEDIELELLLQAVFLKYHYDFRQYARSSLHGRLLHLMARLKCPSLTALQDQLLHDDSLWAEFLPFLIVAHTEFFRNPSYYSALRTHVFPKFKEHHEPSIWIAGCSTGEEVISIAIALEEEGLLEKTKIVASDINPLCLEKAARGVFSLYKAQEGAKTYAESGGKFELSRYYQSLENKAVQFKPELLKNVVFGIHDLAADASPGQYQLVSCRNVLCYFDETLKAHALEVFRESMTEGGVLGLGAMEPLPESTVASAFQSLNAEERLFTCLKKPSAYGSDYLP